MNASQQGERVGAANNLLEPLIDERECSRITGRSVASLRRDRLLGIGIPHVKLTSLVRYDPHDIRAYIERNKHVGHGGGQA
jgi:hypothetical protein